MINKVAVFFTDILVKNVIRRGAGLPEWPVREAYQKSVRDAAWREYLAEHGSRIRAKVLAEQQLRHGSNWPMSGGGRMAFSLLVAKALADGFRAKRST